MPENMPLHPCTVDRNTDGKKKITEVGIKGWKCAGINFLINMLVFLKVFSTIT